MAQGEGKRVEQSRAGNARPRTPQQLQRQERVFERSVIDGKTVRFIAKEMGIAQDTVIEDIRQESQRRADELAANRETEQARHLSKIEDLYRRSLQLATTPGTGAMGAASKALEMRAKILGLDAPTRVEVGVAALLDAIDVPES